MKKIFVLFFTIFFSVFYVNAQRSGFSVGVVGNLEGNKYSVLKDLNSEHSYRSHLANSYGLSLKYNTKGKLFFQTGVSHYSQGYDLKYNFEFWDPYDPNMPKYTEFSANYLSIPIELGYKLWQKGKWSINPSMSLNTAIQLNHKVHTYYEVGGDRERFVYQQDLNETQVSVRLKLGMDLSLSEKISLIVAPLIGKGLNKLNEETMETGQWIYGGSFGLFMRI